MAVDPIPGDEYPRRARLCFQDLEPRMGRATHVQTLPISQSTIEKRGIDKAAGTSYSSMTKLIYLVWTVAGTEGPVRFRAIKIATIPAAKAATASTRP
jgi:hypothetical protein